MVTVQPFNLSRQNMTTAKADGTSQWNGGSLLPYSPSVAMKTAQPLFYDTAYPLQFKLIINATAQTTNTYEMQVLGRNRHAIAVTSTGGFTASVLVEATLDGVNWATLGTITTSTINQYQGLYQSIRVSIPSYTSGTITVTGMTMRS